MAYHGHICGFYYIADEPTSNPYRDHVRKYLPQVDLAVRSTMTSWTVRTTLTQIFVNPLSDKAIPELRYIFPLYDGVSVVGFACTINKDRIIQGVVKERNDARKAFGQAIARGETASLLEQLPDASDVFTTTVGNIPSGAEIKVDITYLGELKHDAEVLGTRYTLPTSIAPRYGDYPGELVKGTNVSTKEGIKITVDVEMPRDSDIKSVQSPSHPISVTIGNTSAGAESGAAMSLQKASATLSLGTAELGKDFVLHVVATDTGNPTAVLETHPTLPNHRAIMATLVPRFTIPPSRPEIVFVCDRSGSMDAGQRIHHLKVALHIFLKSLPLGVKFNICSFGSHHELLFDKGAVSYDAASVEKAMKYFDSFAADYGGTEMYRPLEDVIQKRHNDTDLEVFLLTDGEVWNHRNLINLVNKSVDESNGSIRVFTLGIGDGVSHALIEGLARAGNGFSQTVMDNEKMNSKVLRMLKAALTPHIGDYSLEIKYEADSKREEEDSGFEIVEKVIDGLTIDTRGFKLENEGTQEGLKKTISLFDAAADPDAEMKDVSQDTTAGGRYSGVRPVPEPKLLQAPFIIPPLYPFNRTSVYLLLSPESVQRSPKSIVLRGTCTYGPLELEIPVTVLPGKAETIHQLAARKTIRELEEGRGWIFHSKDTGDGRLLKDKFPGRFSDMVEREAVRLGVKFQVGGKWCSFVAVEEGPAQVSGSESRQESTRHAKFEDLAGHAPSQIHSKTRHMYRRAASSFRPHAYSATGSRLASRRGVGTMSRAGEGPSNAVPSMPIAFGAFAHPSPRTPMMTTQASASYNAFSAEITTAMDPIAQKLAVQGQSSAALAHTGDLASECQDDDSSGDEMGFALFDDMGHVPPAASSQPKDPFETVVALQSFEGYWEWKDELFGALKMDGDIICLQAQMSSNQAIAALGSDLSTTSDKLATAIVLAWLETKIKNRKDEWEMLADKAYRWLEATMSNGVAGSYVSIVRDMVADTWVEL